MSKRHLKHRLLHILEGDPAAGKPGRFVQLALIALVIANIVSIILESVHHLHTDYLAYFHGFEVFSIVVFTIEYLARFWTAPEKHEDQPWLARRKYALSFFGLIDLISILPFYLQFFVPGMDLRILRVVRLLRTFKLSHRKLAQMGPLS